MPLQTVFVAAGGTRIVSHHLGGNLSVLGVSPASVSPRQILFEKRKKEKEKKGEKKKNATRNTLTFREKMTFMVMMQICIRENLPKAGSMRDRHPTNETKALALSRHQQHSKAGGKLDIFSATM